VDLGRLGTTFSCPARSQAVACIVDATASRIWFTMVDKDPEHILGWAAIRFSGENLLSKIGSIRTPELMPAVEAFIKNAKRAIALCDVPVEMVSAGQWFQAAHTAASMEVFGLPQPPEAESNEHAALPAGEFERYRQRTRELLSGRTTGNVYAWRTVNKFRRDRLLMTDVVHHVFLEFEGEEDRASEIYRTLMYSQLILSWTAFETLAGDLWEAALNVHPNTLASLFSKRPEQKDKDGNSRKSLPMSELERHRFDISRKMGTILRERVKFTTLDNITESYRSAFPPPARANSEAFWDNTDLKSVSVIRNLLVHKGGIVDEDFLDKRGADVRLATYKNGDMLRMTGGDVQEMTLGLLEFSRSLIEDVDSWIASNP